MVEKPTGTDRLRIARDIHHLAACLRTEIDAALAPLGLGLAGFDVLRTLRDAGPPHERTPSELGRAAALTSGAMTNRIDKLARAGLVTRRARSRGDRRQVAVRITTKGMRLVERALPRYEDIVLGRLADLDAGDVAALSRGLAKASAPRGEPAAATSD